MIRRKKDIFDMIYDIEREAEQNFEVMWDLKNKRLEPLTYIDEKEDIIVISADLPLVKKKDIKLNLIDDLLEINATMHRCVTFKKWGTSQKKCEFQFLYKAIKLPNLINMDKMKAKFDKGILTIEIPKKIKQYKIKVE